MSQTFGLILCSQTVWREQIFMGCFVESEGLRCIEARGVSDFAQI